MVHYRTWWTLPGGGVHPGESPAAAALRELDEETGLNGRVVRRLFDDCFLVEVPPGSEAKLGHDPELPPDGQHLHGVKWFPLAEKRSDRQVARVIDALGLPVNAWDGLDAAWREAFRQAWDAVRAGSIGVGAVLSRGDGTIVRASRNRVAEAGAPVGEVFGSTLAHAEMNALARVPFGSTRDLVLTTTLQPCLQCSAVIRMAPVAHVRIAGRDPLWDGCEDFTSLAPWVARRQPVPIEGPLPGEVAIFAVLLSRFGLGLIPSVEAALRAAGQGRIIELARELETSGRLRALTNGTVEDAFVALVPDLMRLT